MVAVCKKVLLLQDPVFLELRFLVPNTVDRWRSGLLFIIEVCNHWNSLILNIWIDITL